MKTDELVKYLDELLRTSEIQDDSVNGLQVANSGSVQKIALAVDVSEPAIQKASQLDAELLLVHHGLFWGKSEPIRGALYERIRGLIQNDIALYASHLPLDMHPELGNNAQAVSIMDWSVTDEFGDYHGQILGKEIHFKTPVSLQQIADDLSNKLNCSPVLWEFGKAEIQTAGYVSGGAISMLPEAIEKELDLYITGEPRHGSYWIAKEAGINVLFAGHYATETLGVQALGVHLQKKFGLEVKMIELPTGL
ncbi:Nif3-like dinuclear metal center hexameric protein [candidate division KSB1 bacterium]|nr:Nif3-like dinuclear metal center hexameric protein [candidate division KSB1 bacterium]